MAQQVGLSANYVLFDSWFSSPKAAIALKEEHGLNTIAMVKKVRLSTNTRVVAFISKRYTKRAVNTVDISNICFL